MIEESKENEYGFDYDDANNEPEFDANLESEVKQTNANVTTHVTDEEKEKLITQSKDFIDNLFSTPFHKQTSIHSFTNYKHNNNEKRAQITERSLVSTSSKWKEKSEAFTNELFQIYNNPNTNNAGTANVYV